MDFIGSNLFMLLDLAMLAFGVFLLINPKKAYNFGSMNSEKREIPKNWHIVGRIIGVVFITIGAAFLIVRFT